MLGLMQDHPLTLQHIMWRMEKLFSRREVVTLREHGLHRETNAELVARANQLAGALDRLGIGAGDRVATLAWNNWRHLELYFAVPNMGAVLHTLNLRLHPDQLEFIIRDADDRVLIVDASLLPIADQLAGRMPSVRHVIVMSDGDRPPASGLDHLLDYETLLAGESTAFPWPRLDERAAAGVCYTSGTTGNPKGAVYSHRSQFLHAMATMQSSCFALSADDAVLPVVPLFHANAWGIPYGAAMAGAKILFPDRWMGDGAKLVELAAAENATILAGVPTIWINLLNHIRSTGVRLPGVRLVVSGGSAVPPALMRGMDEVGLRILHAWGMTETSPLGTLAHPHSWHDPEQAWKARLSQGQISPAVEMRIVDIETGAELPWNGVDFGEVQVRGPWVASGYLNGADPDKFTADGWFRTGDVATLNEEGYLNIVDRTKDVIKSGGEWISSIDLENAIMAHPKVLEAAVIGLPHSKWQERPVAYVVPKPEYRDSITADEIAGFLAERVARWWLPDEIRFISEVPKTSTGKFDKKVLRASASPINEEVPARQA